MCGEAVLFLFFCSSRRRHTRCALVTGVQTCALPIYVDRCTELGVSKLLPTPSWQIDRGRFENFLGKRALALGVDFRDAATVRAVDLGEGDDEHRVTFERNGTQQAMSSRWGVDAGARAALLNQMGKALCGVREGE